MIRWSVVRTLLHKEFLRYRYNPGPLVVVLALVILAGLMAFGQQWRILAGQSGPAISKVVLFCPPESAWAEALTKRRLRGILVERKAPLKEGETPVLSGPTLGIELLPGPVDAVSGRPAAQSKWKVRYWYLSAGQADLTRIRDWFERGSQDYLANSPRLESESRLAPGELGSNDQLPMLIAGFVLFAIYLHAFQLFLTTTAEEREKRQMLALLLSPVTPSELLAAKALFYTTASLLVAAAVQGLYAPRVLLQPVFWTTVLMSSAGYLLLATLALIWIRKQNTLNSVPMVYLLGMGIVIVLSASLPVFGALRRLLIEDYLVRQIHLLTTNQWPWWWPLNQLALLGLVAIWSLVLIRAFRRRGDDFSRPG